MDKRSFFLVLLGCSGTCLVLLAHFLTSGATLSHIVLVATNIHNASLSYQASFDLDVTILEKNKTSKSRDLARNDDPWKTQLEADSGLGQGGTLGKERFYILPNSKRNADGKAEDVIDLTIGENDTTDDEKYKLNEQIGNSLDSYSYNHEKTRQGLVYKLLKRNSNNRYNNEKAIEIVFAKTDNDNGDVNNEYFDVSSNIEVDANVKDKYLENSKAVSDLVDKMENPQTLTEQQTLAENNTNLNQTDDSNIYLLDQNDNDLALDTKRVGKIKHEPNQDVLQLGHIEKSSDALIPNKVEVGQTYTQNIHGELEKVSETNKFHETSDTSTNGVPASTPVKVDRTISETVNSRINESNTSPKFSNRLLNIESIQLLYHGNYSNGQLSIVTAGDKNGVVQEMDTKRLRSNTLVYRGPDVNSMAVYADKETGGLRMASVNVSGDEETNKPFSVDQACVHRVTGVEDILCMRKPQFLPEYRNPCWREAGHLRCLPYFHIIGVCKTGTTDLFERLSHHPQIIKNTGILGKETWYWTWRRYGHTNFYAKTTPRMTLDEFIRNFNADAIDSIARKRDNTVFYPTVTGHGDPMDFYDHTSWKMIPQNDPSALLPNVTTPSLVHHVNPDVKLILLLRDPVERLFSNYLHGQFGRDSRQFHRDVLYTVDVLNNCAAYQSMTSCLYDDNIMKLYRVPISGSFYSIHLKEWLNVFPRQQIFITRTEDFASNVAGTLLNIFRFLKLDPIPTRDLYRIANMPHFYNTRARETAGDILPETRKLLQDLFEPYNQELASILGDSKFHFNPS